MTDGRMDGRTDLLSRPPVVHFYDKPNLQGVPPFQLQKPIYLYYMFLSPRLAKEYEYMDLHKRVVERRNEMN